MCNFEHLETHKLFLSFTREQVNANMATWAYTTAAGHQQYQLPCANHGIDLYQITYKSKNCFATADAPPLILSGLVAIPQTSETLAMVSFQHGTMSQKIDVPSNFNFQSQSAVFAFSSGNYVTVFTDYPGLGINPGWHPYVMSDPNSQAAIDCIRAARELLTYLKLNFSNDLYVSGYSEGGLIAMAVTKSIIEMKYPTFNLKRSAPLSGAYRLASPFKDVYLSANFRAAAFVSYFGYLLMTWQNYYGGIYESLQDVFRYPFYSTLPRLYDGALPLQTTTLLIQQAMKEQKPQVPHHLINHLGLGNKQLLEELTLLGNTFTIEFLERMVIQNSNDPLVKRIQENARYDWSWKNPPVTMEMLLVGAMGDQEVFFANTLETVKAMRKKGVGPTQLNYIDLGLDYSHDSAVTPAQAAARLFFDNGFDDPAFSKFGRNPS